MFQCWPCLFSHSARPTCCRSRHSQQQRSVNNQSIDKTLDITQKKTDPNYRVLAVTSGFCKVIVSSENVHKIHCIMNVVTWCCPDYTVNVVMSVWHYITSKNKFVFFILLPLSHMALWGIVMIIVCLSVCLPIHTFHECDISWKKKWRKVVCCLIKPLGVAWKS